MSQRVTFECEKIGWKKLMAMVNSVLLDYQEFYGVTFDPPVRTRKGRGKLRTIETPLFLATKRRPR